MSNREEDLDKISFNAHFIRCAVTVVSVIFLFSLVNIRFSPANLNAGFFFFISYNISSSYKPTAQIYHLRNALAYTLMAILVAIAPFMKDFFQ